MNEQTRICLENADLALRPPELITPVPREYYPEIDDYTMSSGHRRARRAADSICPGSAEMTVPTRSCCSPAATMRGKAGASPNT